MARTRRCWIGWCGRSWTRWTPSGSSCSARARGDASAESGFDLIVVEAEPFGAGRSRHAEEVRLYRVLAGCGASKDILVYSRDEVEYWRDSLDNVLARALREGKTLHERP